MNELQLGLIGLGVACVIAVWAYNVWQDRRHRQRAEKVLPTSAGASPDVLMAGQPPAGERSEPVFGTGMAEPAVPPAPSFSAPGQAGLPALPLPADDAPACPLPAEWADGQADCLLRIEFVDPVAVGELWAAHQTWSSVIDKPLQWLGLDVGGQRWRHLLPQDPGKVSQLAVALQLADRRGPVDEKNLTVFLGGVQQLAQRFSGLVELPAVAAVLGRAQALDALCAGVDLQLTLYVVPREGSLSELVSAKLGPLIEAAALRLEGERFVATDAEGVEVFALSGLTATGVPIVPHAQAALSAIALSIDVPRVANGPDGFDRMIGFARQCAEALGGQLADPHRKPLAEPMIGAIRARIADLQGQMAAQGIPAGSIRALRLFA